MQIDVFQLQTDITFVTRVKLHTAFSKVTIMPSKKGSHETDQCDETDHGGSIFELDDPKVLALALKQSAELSRRRKEIQLRSAMSRLTLYINRASTELPPEWRLILEAAKVELRAPFQSDRI